MREESQSPPGGQTVSGMWDGHAGATELLPEVTHEAVAMGTDAGGLMFAMVTETTGQGEHRQTFGVSVTTERRVHKNTPGFLSKHAGLSLL